MITRSDAYYDSEKTSNLYGGKGMWFMDERFAQAKKLAEEILSEIKFDGEGIISLSAVIRAVEKRTSVTVRFAEYDFSKLSSNTKNKDRLEKCGAAMCVESDESGKLATILLNKKESPEMKRFSLVHELGHLLLDPPEEIGAYRVSTHINMDIVSFPKHVIESMRGKPVYDILLNEQSANIFAIMVLLPYEILKNRMEKERSLEAVAKSLGVDPKAVCSRLILYQEERDDGC